tara:strand:- start:415 stop:1065 length:651 start_codon:yes stop_codon:yes gene_type:complete
MFNPNDINIFENVLPLDINSEMHSVLMSHPRWTVVSDNLPIDIFQLTHGGCDAGMIICSYRNLKSNSIRIESERIRTDSDQGDPTMNDLNFYGDLIKKLILNKCIVKNGYTSYEAFFNITTVRYFWNYYHDSSVGVPHTDINEPNHWSIIYYLNDNPGKGTIVWKPNEDGTVEEILVPHVAGNACIFPSHWRHSGTTPNKNTHRSCLNILFKAELR